MSSVKRLRSIISFDDCKLFLESLKNKDGGSAIKLS